MRSCRESVTEQAHRLSSEGICVVRDGIDKLAVMSARKTIIENTRLFKNTRKNRSSGHLAGFHRFPQLEHLQAVALSSGRVMSILHESCHAHYFRTIGLSDITINRSQNWHVDLLRGSYRRYLNDKICWHPKNGGGVFKVLLYLQPGKSLRFIAGSHLARVGLEMDSPAELVAGRQIDQLSINSGDIVIMDVRLVHRGSSEDELDDIALLSAPKILVSTVLGSSESPLTRAMEVGNFNRLMDWDEQHSSRKPPELSGAAK